MREINLQRSHTISFSFTSEDFTKAKTNLGKINTSDSLKHTQTAQLNGGKILYAATDISKDIENIICNFLFGSSPQPSSEKNFFRNEIVQSSALSFQFKKEILQIIINEKKLLQGKEKATIQQHLKSIADWRNAFAHGNLEYNNKKGTLLSYYSGSNKQYVLDNQFWNSVEYTFSETHEMLKKILEATSKLPDT